MIGQLSRFASVGLVATLLHVIVALIVKELFQFSAQLANLIGFSAAVGLSYIGHIWITFRVNPVHSLHLPRFLFIALLGLAASSTITFVVHTKLGASFGLAMGGVAILVPLLTFLASKYWVFTKAEAGKPHWLPGFISALLVAGTFLAVFSGRYLNHDVAWYLVATRKWLEGAQLYIDLVEVNPPLSFYLTVPAIWLADLFGMSDSDAQYVLIAGLLVISLTWVWHLLGDNHGLSMPRRLIFIVTTGIMVIFPAGANIAQREHLMLIMLLPYLFGYVLLHDPDRGKGAIARTAFGALGFCIKPHFMLFPITFTMVRIWQGKSLKPIISLSNIVILIVGIGYVGLVFAFHPAYLSTIVPMALHIYGDYSFGAKGVFQTLPPVLIAIIASYIIVLMVGPNRSKGAVYFAAALFAATGSYLLQWTGFPYQLLPVISLIAMASIWIFVQSEPRLIFRLVMGVGLVFVLTTSAMTGFYRNWAMAELSGRVKVHGQAPRLMVFSTELAISFPLTLETGAIWTSRYPALWLIPGAINGLERENCISDPDKCAVLEDILKLTRRDIVTDFETGSPDVLIFDHRAFFILNKDFDFIQFLSVDPRFEGLLANYEIDVQTKEYTIWARTK